MILVVGTGVTGLTAALAAAGHDEVVLVTKATLGETNTALAQGGIAAALTDDDSPAQHAADTAAAGAGLTDPAAVRVLTEEGPERVRELIARGIPFDRDGAGRLAAGLEAAHSRHRIVHADGDRTGAALQAGLSALLPGSGIRVREHRFLLDLVLASGRVVGARFLDASAPAGQSRPETILADAVILATGGAGQLFAHTTNPAVATGDGIAAAFRAGARVADLEFFQFHPTALAATGPESAAPLPLVSEAVRGAGAVLLGADGTRFMPARHPLGELAPRDEVARGIAAQMAAQGGAPVRLDATRVPDLARRFPGITALCAAAGLDWTREPVPVAPAAHSLMGGIRTDRHGRSSLPGLYAAGESACSGVHGANRLASNSLLEGLVFGQRAALAALRDRAGGVGPDTTPVPQADEAIPSRELLLLRPAAATPETASALPDRDELRALAWAELGLSRSEVGLRATGQRFDAWAAAGDALPADAAVAERETANLALLGSLLAAAALRRAESRGAHARLDAPEPRAEWVLRQVFRAEAAPQRTPTSPVPAAAPPAPTLTTTP